MHDRHRIERTSRDDDAPIPLADDPAPPPNATPPIARPNQPTPQATQPLPARPGPAVRCPRCGYDIRNIGGDQCPECGIKIIPALNKAAKQKSARAGMRVILLKSLGLVALSFAIVLGMLFLQNRLDAFPSFLLSYAITLPLSLLGFYFCCMVWIGFDLPFPVVALRMTAILAMTDAAGILASVVPIIFFSWMVMFIVYAGLIAKWLELEWSEAAIVAFVVLGISAGVEFFAG